VLITISHHCYIWHITSYIDVAKPLDIPCTACLNSSIIMSNSLAAPSVLNPRWSNAQNKASAKSPSPEHHRAFEVWLFTVVDTIGKFGLWHMPSAISQQLQTVVEKPIK
jgi:hypothetical protein